ncbi:hypothetical protein LR48_Vigan02g121900 [Vigna angularis]|uniref:JmjC domain-containing protein n=1 Tax=Phaseolus angularis TaxID=3914 RepID=A0A0L9TY11_PHAAN|nr:hypothetical protein LR48_Vigan02g121900 [Vigna angularis]
MESSSSSSIRIRRFDELPTAKDFDSVIELSNVPAVFRGCTKSWKAFSHWNPSNGGLDYLQARVGSCTVEAMVSQSAPVFYGDLGSHQRVPLPFSNFLDFCKKPTQMQSKRHHQGLDHRAASQTDNDTKHACLSLEDAPKQIYLAQVPIMNSDSQETVQLETLKEDILTPSILASKELSSINLWMNNAEARSSTHYDPHHNLLCIVSGCKRVVLWPPSASPSLYPMPIYGEASNHSSVSLENPDYSIYPRAECSMEFAQKVVLQAGDALFIPEGWGTSVRLGLNHPTTVETTTNLQGLTTLRLLKLFFPSRLNGIWTSMTEREGERTGENRSVLGDKSETPNIERVKSVGGLIEQLSLSCYNKALAETKKHQRLGLMMASEGQRQVGGPKFSTGLLQKARTTASALYETLLILTKENMATYGGNNDKLQRENHGIVTRWLRQAWPQVSVHSTAQAAETRARSTNQCRTRKRKKKSIGGGIKPVKVENASPGRNTTNTAAQEVTETLTHFLIARDASDPSFSQSNSVFVRVDNNPVPFPDAEDAGFDDGTGDYDDYDGVSGGPLPEDRWRLTASERSTKGSSCEVETQGDTLSSSRLRWILVNPSLKCVARKMKILFHQVDSDDLTIAVNFWWRSNMMSCMLEHMDAYYLRRILRRQDQLLLKLGLKTRMRVCELPNSGQADHGDVNDGKLLKGMDLKEKRVKERNTLQELEPAAVQVLHELVSLVHNIVNANQDRQSLSTSTNGCELVVNDKFEKIVSADFKDDPVAKFLWDINPQTLQAVFLAMAHNFPRTLEALVLHVLSPVGAEVLTRKFDEMDQHTLEEDRNGFYEAFYSAFDDQSAAMNSILKGKELFTQQDGISLIRTFCQ